MDDADGGVVAGPARRLQYPWTGGIMGTETSIAGALLVGLAGLVGSGALASGLGWLAQAACAWCGLGG